MEKAYDDLEDNGDGEAKTAKTPPKAKTNNSNKNNKTKQKNNDDDDNDDAAAAAADNDDHDNCGDHNDGGNDNDRTHNSSGELSVVCMKGEGAVRCKPRTTYQTLVKRNMSWTMCWQGTAYLLSLIE